MKYFLIQLTLNKALKSLNNGIAGSVVDIKRYCFHSNPTSHWLLNVLKRTIVLCTAQTENKIINYNACLGIIYTAYIFITLAFGNLKISLIYFKEDVLCFLFYCLQVMGNHFAHNSLAKWNTWWSTCGFFPFLGTIKHFIFALQENKWNCSHSSNG